MVPTRRFVVLVALGVVPAVLALRWPGMAGVAATWDIALCLLLGADLLLGPRRSDLEASREVEDVLSLSAPCRVSLLLVWHGPRPVHVRLVDSPPDRMTSEGHRQALGLAPRSRTRITYRVTPHERGEAHFGDLHLRLAGPMNLAQRTHRIPLAREVKVYPDITALIQGEQAVLQKVDAGDLRARRRPAEGREFDSLREYVSGDDVRLIDWKATARHGEPITRQYRPEQNQDVLLLVDCGRQMRPRIGNYTKLDFAVNTALTLAHVALTRGDQVGLVVFDHEVRTYLPPRKGRDQLMRVVDALYRVRPTLTESDYHAAYDALGRRALRRALVVTFTDLIDEESSRILLSRTAVIRRRHLPLVVTISDSDLLQVAAAVPRTRADAHRRIAASRVVRDHQATVRRLVTGGALLVDVPAEELSAATLGSYLELKARGAL